MPSAKYYNKDPELYKKQKQEWVENNKQYIAEYNYYYRNGKYTKKEYKQKYKKSMMITNWKTKNMDTLGYTWDEIYDIYVNTQECFYCGINFKDRKKNLDHSHINNRIRGILCSSCNRVDVLKNID